MIDPTKLVAQGVTIQYEDVWDGEGAARHSEPDTSRIRGVFLNLTPEDWCRVAMHEGAEYIGGCCGTTSAMQDVVNGIFRDGGYADADAMYSLGEFAKHHPDGFEGWSKKMSQKNFDEQCKLWSKFGAWQKIGLCWQAVRDKVRPWRHNIEPIVLENRPDLDEKREIDEMYGAMHLVRFSSLRGPGSDASGQRRANDVMAFAKLYPGAKRLVAKLESEREGWRGFAVVEKTRPEIITHNGYGLCLYNTEKDVRDFLKVLDRDDRYEKKERGTPRTKPSDNLLIRPILISVTKGISFGTALEE